MKKMKIAPIALLLAQLFFANAFCQAPGLISHKTQEIVSKIEEKNVVMNDAVGIAGRMPEEYINFQKLVKVAKKAELVELSNHQSAAVRCYSFWALSYNHSVDLFPIILAHINDTAEVETQFGCIGNTSKVGDFIINIVTPQHIDLESKKLDSATFAHLDSILVYSESKLDARDAAISRIATHERHYSRINKLAVIDKNPIAFVALAKYQKDSDVAFFSKLLKQKTKKDDSSFWVYKAVQQFQHPDFLPLLENRLFEIFNAEKYSTTWGQLYKAIACYKNEKSLELLSLAIKNVSKESMKKYHSEYIFNAVMEYRDTVYDELLWNLWINEKQVNYQSVDYLINTDFRRGVAAIETTLESPGEYPGIRESEYEDLKEQKNLLEYMLDVLISDNRKKASEVIVQNIRKSNVHLFREFAKKAAELQDKTFIEPLFERLQNESNAHVYLPLVETLLSYNSSEVNARINKTMEVNPNLTQGWGGKDLAKILKDRKLTKMN